MQLQTTSEWLALTPMQRHDYVGTTVGPLLERNPEVSLRYFDTHAFSATVSDVAMWETTTVEAYQSLMEELRETEFWTRYFEIIDILPAIENDLADHEHASRPDVSYPGS